MNPSERIRGRGANHNPATRFQTIFSEPDPEWDPTDSPLPRTEFIPDKSATIIARNDSPDIGFEASVNPYRGCEHGCIYCYARPTHEYLGYSAGLDFETRILVKFDAPQLLRAELSKRSWKPQVIAMSGVTDCYQPVERELRITRGCLEVLAEFRNPVAIVTKNSLVARDAKILADLARHRAAVVFVSITTLDLELKKRLEPRTTPAAGRLEAIRALNQAGVPVGVIIAPVIPAINDHEIPRIVEAAVAAGAQFAAWTFLRLPLAVAPLFEKWLDTHFPDRKAKVLNQIRAIRNGQLNDSRFGSRMRGEGPASERISQLFRAACLHYRLPDNRPELSTASFRRPSGAQLELL